MDGQQEKNIVIIGGGIIGCTTAYFLTRHPKFNPSLHRITLLEATSIAAGASGKAGGLLALWAYPECLVPLSYRLHRELAEEHGGPEKWGYRRLGCGTIAASVKNADLQGRKAATGRAYLKTAAPAPALTALDANGSRDGHEDGNGAAPQPTAPTVNDSKVEGNGEPKADKEDKEWEKLPKQDVAATSLLGDSPLPSDLDWIDPKLVQYYEEMGRRGETETSQVHPYHFTTSIAELARSAGVDIRIGAKVTKVTTSKDDGTKTVDYEDRQHEGAARTIRGVTDVIVTAGPWTGKLLPRSKVEGLRAHSVVYEADVSPYAVFTDIALPSDFVPEHREKMGQKRKHRGNVDPEIYARPFGEVYACGEPDKNVPLPDTADQVQCDEAQCDDLTAYIGTISPQLASAPIKAKQACYLPRHMRFGEERGPLIGQTSTPGVWIAAGHTCWGIQNGPGTGCLMAELLFDGEAKSADVDVLDPKKFKV
ncbi:Putative oxidoreductase TDA3 [Cytospora mali]|uniref:Oxidoreductase TDA3 n=1 Tax=Cytospora mali TaxID=578113 RepID=A0A194UM35_CYTMA|nr:Putative oxidoreductase TDA3 [Valsa mali var. pyri (nom. inval.)]